MSKPLMRMSSHLAGARGEHGNVSVGCRAWETPRTARSRSGGPGYGGVANTGLAELQMGGCQVRMDGHSRLKRHAEGGLPPVCEVEHWVDY